MIPRASITAWRHQAPWAANDQVEHDLVLSRVICALYQHSVICENLVFRGGTALHKLFFERSGRFSEDLDFVQVTAQPIGTVANAIRNCLDDWLGKPNWKQNEGRFTLNYRFDTEFSPSIRRKVKIEINTREHFVVNGYITKTFDIENNWFSGQANVLTYSVEELLGTKLRALYQRKKGRDLYDMWYAFTCLPQLNRQTIVAVFNQYMKFENKIISHAAFEENLYNKYNDKIFSQDILPLLAAEQFDRYHPEEAYLMTQKELLSLLSGETWKGLTK